jgi:hypothetical protein
VGEASAIWRDDVYERHAIAACADARLIGRIGCLIGSDFLRLHHERLRCDKDAEG